jgi:hypothetical protein
MVGACSLPVPVDGFIDEVIAEIASTLATAG